MHIFPTYQHALSTIDYVFAASSFRHFVKDTYTAVGFIPAPWCENAVLEVNFNLRNSKWDPGLWRGNTAYINNLDFQAILETKIINNTIMESMDTNISPQEQWDMIKTVTKKGVEHVHWRPLSINHLEERKRARLLRSKPPNATALMEILFLLRLRQELVLLVASWGNSGSNTVVTTDDSASDGLCVSGDSADYGDDSGGPGSDGGSDGCSSGDGGSDAPTEVASTSAPGDSGGSVVPNGGIYHPRTSNQL
ncbi:unnamed protein product [Mucor circinelloides]